MKNTGIKRKLDILGRITLPAELRKDLGMGEREEIEICREGDCIILKKPRTDTDVFTGQTRNLIEYKGKMVSEDSIRELANLLLYK